MKLFKKILIGGLLVVGCLGLNAGPKLTASQIHVIDSIIGDMLDQYAFGVPLVRDGKIYDMSALVNDTISQTSVYRPFLEPGQFKFWERSSDTTCFILYRGLNDSLKVFFWETDYSIGVY